MENILIIPIIFLVLLILVITFCIIKKCKKKKKNNIVKDIDITEINKFCGIAKQPLPTQSINDFSQFERIKHHVKNEKLKNSLQDAHRSPRVNESVLINMIMLNPTVKRVSNNHSSNIVKDGGIQIESKNLI
jgi:hypothetical protein